MNPGMVLVFAVVLGNPVAGDVPTVEGIQKHLSQRYPVKMQRMAGELQFERDASVIELNTPAMRQAGKGLHLYHTTYTTGHWCYWEVQVAIAAWMENGELKTAECFSPTYTGEKPEFVAALCKLSGKTKQEREQLASEICEVFRQITYRGRIVDGGWIGTEYRAELWHNNRLWRTVSITFDGTGAITDVELFKGK